MSLNRRYCHILMGLLHTPTYPPTSFLEGKSPSKLPGNVISTLDLANEQMESLISDPTPQINSDLIISSVPSLNRVDICMTFCTSVVQIFAAYCFIL